MKVESKISVRDLCISDIKFIADYWLNADKIYLLGMGVDASKLPTRDALTTMLLGQLDLPYTEKSSFALIFEVDGLACGHCNVNGINFGHEAKMHLHLWSSDLRQKGFGTSMVIKSLPVFIDRLKLKVIYCEPYALNPAPNKTLQKIGFEFVKRYVTIPGSLNFEQEVNRYKLTRIKFEELYIS